MSNGMEAGAKPVVVARDLRLVDLGRVLATGWRDFRTYPVYGLFFGAIYVVGGLLLFSAVSSRASVAWLIPVGGGFPLVAPFLAVGLYEVSRRHEQALPIRWGVVVRALLGHGDEQLLMMGGYLFVGFTFWVILAHSIFAIFLAGAAQGSESLAFLVTPSGLAMLAVGGSVGALMAFAFYAVTVISIPMMVDRDVDFITATLTSLTVIRDNGLVMLVWGAFVAVALFVAMLPWFLGLLVVLPVLAHATWALYRRTVEVGEAAGPAPH